MAFPSTRLVTGAFLLASVPLAHAQSPGITSFDSSLAGDDGVYAVGITDVIDFETLTTGEIVSSVHGAAGTGPILVDGFNPSFGMGTNAAIVFDSSLRTGGDTDLGTPNEDFMGPGVDGMLGDNLGGEAGSPFQNDTAHGKILIIAEDLVDGNGDGFVDDPDDAAVQGSLFTFDFSALGGVIMRSMLIIDVEADEDTAFVEFFDAADMPLGGTVFLPHTGDNGVAEVDLGDVAGVYKMVLTLNGSGAIDEIEYSTMPDCEGKIGDLVWLDENCNGLQDDEPGIPNVRIILLDRFGGFVAATTTDADGFYRFTGLCASRYEVIVDEDTLPPGLKPTQCNVGGNDRIDSECSPHVTILDPDEVDRTIDFGYCDMPSQGGQGCTPGYWKQPQHFDSWPAPYTPWTAFGDVFDDAFPGMTLLQVAAQGGGGLKALGRHTVAALLNAASGGVDYGPSVSDVIDMFNDAYANGGDDIEDQKDIFAGLNESGCPLN